MKDSFTIDELKSFLEEIKNRNHLQYYYRTLSEEEYQVDMEQFYAGMNYFLQDLQTHLNENNKPEVERNNTISSYKNPIEALNNLWKHVKWSYINLTICKFPNNGKGVLYEHHGSIGPLKYNFGSDFDNTHPESDWTHNEDYHAHYDEENNALIFFVNI